MNLSEFAYSRNQKPATISMYIKRHAEEFKGHLTADGKNIIIDDEAYAILDQQYPNPQVVQVVQDEQLRKDYEDLNRKYTKALEDKDALLLEIKAKAEQIAAAEYVQKQLEDAEARGAEQKQRIDALEQAKEKLQEEKNSAEKENVRLQMESDQARKEAASYKKSIFGLYKKIK